MTRLDWRPLTGLVHLTREQAIRDLDAHHGDTGSLTTRIKYTLHGYQAQIGLPRDGGARPEEEHRYWKRWGGTTLPLQVIEVVRQTDAGGWQVARDGEWVTVPGESYGRAMYEATMFDEISEAEAVALTRQSALSADVPRFTTVEDQTNRYDTIEGVTPPGPRCESGWTGDRCELPLFHAGRHSNEVAS